MLSRVLEEAVTAAIDGAAIADGEKQELSSRLGKVIMDHFTAGQTDPRGAQESSGGERRGAVNPEIAGSVRGAFICNAH
jgi:hypothetical protein